MRRNGARQSQQMSQIIELSGHYITHLQRLVNARPVVKVYDTLRDMNIERISSQKTRYNEAARRFKNEDVSYQNCKIALRIARAQSRYSKLNLSRSLSRQSMSTVRSNSRRRVLRQEEITRQNAEISKRLLKPKGLKLFDRKEMNKSYEREQSYALVRRRFSERNQQIISTLALKQLKIPRKGLSFVAQLEPIPRRSAPKSTQR